LGVVCGTRSGFEIFGQFCHVKVCLSSLVAKWRLTTVWPCSVVGVICWPWLFCRATTSIVRLAHNFGDVFFGLDFFWVGVG
jgi:hypothetical protein